MFNECIFFIYVASVTLTALYAARISREAVVVLLCSQCMLMNLFVTKEITLFGLIATAADALGVGVALCLNILQELYGKAYAQRAIWLGLGCSLLYVMYAMLHCAFIPSVYDASNIHFLALLLPMPRIIIASLFSYIVVQYADSYLYELFTKAFRGRFFTLRSNASIAITQFLDTILFSILGLYGLMHNIGSIIIVSYFIKLVVLMMATPFLFFFKRILTPKSHV